MKLTIEEENLISDLRAMQPEFADAWKKMGRMLAVQSEEDEPMLGRSIDSAANTRLHLAADMNVSIRADQP